MKRSLAIRMLSIMCCFTITGCGNILSSAKEKDDTQKEDNTEDTKKNASNEESSADKNKSDDNEKDKDKDKDEKKDGDASLTSDLGLGSEQDILSYLEGDWTLLDRASGEDFGLLSIKDDGSFDFTRLSDSASGYGTISFEYRHADESEAPDGFRIDFGYVDELVPEGMKLYGDEYVDGIYHIGSMGTEDYLYLKEIGNGDTIASMYVFNTDEDSLEDFTWLKDFLFYREKDEEVSASVIENDTFYAWLWKKDGDGVYLQSMNAHEYDAVDEYTDSMFTGGYFNETDDIGILKYECGYDVDLSDMEDVSEWDTDYPLMICEVTTDEDGNILDLKPVEIAMYDIYDMGEVSEDAIMEAYQQILYKYKEAQDGQYSMEELEAAGFYTELMQHGWPYASTNDAVGYVYVDVDDNGIDELIITYYDYIIDIYGFDGGKVRLAYSTPYRGIAEIYPDGMLRVLWSGSMSYGSTTWYKYDTTLGDYFPVFDCISDDGVDSYYTFCYYEISDEEYQEVLDCYRDCADYPVWIYEWSDMLTEEEYDAIEPDTDPIVLPASDSLSDVVLPDDYEPVLFSS